MPIGYFRSAPKVDISFDKDSYRQGDELRARVTVHTDRPGLAVHRAVVELVQEHRYTHSAVRSVHDPKTARASVQSGGAVGLASFNKRITSEKVDRIAIGRERLFADGVIRHRTEIFDIQFEIKPPAVRRTTQKGLRYLVSVHFDLPRMRDVEVHRSVPVQLA